jgi:hypothetical protein
MAADRQKLDTSDVDKHIGEEVGGGQMKEPVALIDIRRWLQGMGYPNPVHFDEEAAAAQSPYGTIVAPQSFLLACCPGHGSIPAIVGVIPGSHVVFGGDEFWFNGPAIRPGDLMRSKRRFDGYSLAETKFAGPTMFCRGDSTYTNQRSEVVGRQRSTMVRYRADLARERGHYQDTAETPTWTDEQLGEIERQKSEWVRSGSRGDGPAEVGESLAPRPIGPHTTAQFVTELRALPFQVWGATYMEGTYYGDDAGWIPELEVGESDTDDPALKKGLERGPASGHTNIAKAKLVGLPRSYGYGSSTGTWVLDYVAYWAADRGFIHHAKIDYRSPTFEGDLALLNGVVEETRWEPLLGVHLTKVIVTMRNQDDVLLAKGLVEVQLPPA